MSNAGRPALPANVHLLRGNPSKLSDEELGARTRVPVAIPPCPGFLSPGQRALWAWYAPRLVAAGLIAEFDVGAFARLCVAHDEFARVQRLINRAMKRSVIKATVDTTPSGYKQISALMQARDRIEARLRDAAKEFGLSAASRISATSGQQLSLPGMPDDPMESFLNAEEAVRSAG